MAFNINISDLGTTNTTWQWENQCKEYMEQQQGALKSIYDTYSMFLLMLIIYFIGAVLIDRIIYSSSVGKFKILKKEYPFHLSDKAIKILKSIKNIAMFTMLARTAIYYFLGSSY